MISFGITLFGVFDNLPDIEGATRASDRTVTPSVAGLVLLGMGTIVMIVACIQHWLQLRRLVAGGAERRFSLALAVGSVIAVFGLAFCVALMLTIRS